MARGQAYIIIIFSIEIFFLQILAGGLGLYRPSADSVTVDTVYSELSNAFWHRKKHIFSLPYIKDFSEKKKKIPTKARSIQMNVEILDFCQKEIADLFAKGIIYKSKSLWSCAAFYARKNAEIERGVSRLVINYKPFNDVLE